MAVQGGGLMNLRFYDEFRAGGGGSGRIDLGRGFGPNWSLRMGLEMGGAGLFDGKLDTNDIDLCSIRPARDPEVPKSAPFCTRRGDCTCHDGSSWQDERRIRRSSGRTLG